MACDGMMMVGETECADVTIAEGVSEYIYTFTESYDEIPKVHYACGHGYEEVVTTTNVTITMADTDHEHIGHLTVYIPQEKI